MPEMIDTATLQDTTTSEGALILVGVLVVIMFVGVCIAAWLKPGLSYRHDSETVIVTTIIFVLSILAVVALLIDSAHTGEKILVFDNNTGSIQAIKGGKPISQVLERSKTKIVSVPCVFVANKAKQRHDCTFVNLGKGSFEVWDATVFRQAHTRS